MNDASHPWVRRLGVAAVALGVGAALAGTPSPSHSGRIDVEALAQTVAREDDHITAVELAGWIKDRRPALRVIDVRSREGYEEFHVPTAEHVSLDSLAKATFHGDETIVLYSEGGAHAAQAWVFLRALGYDKVFFLRGGLYEWLSDVMNSALSPTASARDSAAFAPVAELSRYFGGTPHVGVPSAMDEALSVPSHPSDRGASAAIVSKIRRRGC